MIALGSTVTDRITGFTGVVTGYVRYLSGCNQALVAPKVRAGATVAPEWFDEQRLDVGKKPLVKLNNGNNPGFDRAPPKR